MLTPLAFVLNLSLLAPVDASRGGGVIGLVWSIADFRAGLYKALEDTEQYIETHHYSAEVKGKARTFHQKWLKIFGYSEGITGIARDMFWYYLGNKEFHDHNGPLINSLKSLKTMYTTPSPEGQKKNLMGARTTTPKTPEQRHEEHANKLRTIPKHGERLFAKGGVMSNLLEDFKNLVHDDGLAKKLAENLEKSKSIKTFVELLDNPEYIWGGPLHDDEL